MRSRGVPVLKVLLGSFLIRGLTMLPVLPVLPVLPMLQFLQFCQLLASARPFGRRMSYGRSLAAWVVHKGEQWPFVRSHGCFGFGSVHTVVFGKVPFDSDLRFSCCRARCRSVSPKPSVAAAILILGASASPSRSLR